MNREQAVYDINKYILQSKFEPKSCYQLTIFNVMFFAGALFVYHSLWFVIICASLVLINIILSVICYCKFSLFYYVLAAAIQVAFFMIACELILYSVLKADLIELNIYILYLIFQLISVIISAIVVAFTGKSKKCDLSKVHGFGAIAGAISGLAFIVSYVWLGSVNLSGEEGLFFISGCIEMLACLLTYLVLLFSRRSWHIAKFKITENDLLERKNMPDNDVDLQDNDVDSQGSID